MLAGYRHALPRIPPPAGFDVVGARRQVIGYQAGQVGTPQLVTGITEDLGGRAVDQVDRAVLVDADHAIRRRFGQDAVALLALGDASLSRRPFHELARVR